MAGVVGGRRRRAAAALLGAGMAAVAACAAPVRAVTQTPAVLATFAGTLPCADCPGLRTELTLDAAGSSASSGRYTMRETYLERGVTRATSGQWTLTRGTPDRPDAAVYVLSADDHSRPQFWLKVSDAEIRLLGADRRPIDSPMSFSLRRVQAPGGPQGTPR